MNEKQLNDWDFCRTLMHCIGTPRIVCLCGSTRFDKAYVEACERLSYKGEIVLSVGLFGHAVGRMRELGEGGMKKNLDKLHFRKIELSDYILVLNVGGYIGKSTAREILYARHCDRGIEYLEPCQHNVLQLRELADQAEAEGRIWDWRSEQ